MKSSTAAGMRTAATDKHPAYEMLSGPSGTGLDDFYGPEFNAGKKDIAKTMANDDLRLTAVLAPARRLRPHAAPTAASACRRSSA